VCVCVCNILLDIFILNFVLSSFNYFRAGVVVSWKEVDCSIRILREYGYQLSNSLVESF
jgi:hypothetical protein